MRAAAASLILLLASCSSYKKKSNGEFYRNSIGRNTGLEMIAHNAAGDAVYVALDQNEGDGLARLAKSIDTAVIANAVKSIASKALDTAVDVDGTDAVIEGRKIDAKKATRLAEIDAQAAAAAAP